MLLLWFKFFYFLLLHLSTYLSIYLFIYLDIIYVFIWSCVCVCHVSNYKSTYRFNANKNISTANSRNMFYFISHYLFLMLLTMTLIAVLNSFSHILLRLPLFVFHIPFLSSSSLVTGINETRRWWLTESGLKTLQQMHFELITYRDFNWPRNIKHSQTLTGT